MTNKLRPRVLAAGSDLALDLLETALGNEVRLIRARSAREALGHVEHGVDLVVADARPERSHLLRLLRAAKSRRGSAFVDIRRLRRRYGEPLAAEILRELVRVRLQAPQARAASLSSR